MLIIVLGQYEYMQTKILLDIFNLTINKNRQNVNKIDEIKTNHNLLFKQKNRLHRIVLTNVFDFINDIILSLNTITNTYKLSVIVPILLFASITRLYQP